ncbi:hypothetical protein CWS35_37765 (plasmid) [Bradyrhizobium sp. SK17]|nr:hypothetical protein CWS35_37765 [Bradyrhizobium sp. SK17]
MIERFDVPRATERAASILRARPQAVIDRAPFATDENAIIDVRKIFLADTVGIFSHQLEEFCASRQFQIFGRALPDPFGQGKKRTAKFWVSGARCQSAKHHLCIIRWTRNRNHGSALLPERAN